MTKLHTLRRWRMVFIIITTNIQTNERRWCWFLTNHPLLFGVFDWRVKLKKRLPLKRISFTKKKIVLNINDGNR